MLLPIFLWLASDRAWEELRDLRLIAPWSALIAFLMVSNLATFSWTSFRLRRDVRLWVILLVALIGGALITAPLEALSIISILYVLSIPFSVLVYARIKRQRAALGQRAAEADAAAPTL
jgi:CDP-diacylglycerol--serine O-phosphatidyltransferase